LTIPGLYLEHLREELSQGDIVDVLPVGSISELRAMRLWEAEKAEADETKWTGIRYPHGQLKRKPKFPVFKRKEGGQESILFEARLTRCIVVSADCVALAKAQNQSLAFELTERQKNIPWHVAPLEAWPSPGETVQIKGKDVLVADLINEGRISKYLGLPPLIRDGSEIVSQSKIDLRFITPVRPTLFHDVVRVASLTDFGVAVLWAKVFSFFSGRSLERLTCPACKEVRSLDQFLEQPAIAMAAGADQD
jgi:hypothetical protein